MEILKICEASVIVASMIVMGVMMKGNQEQCKKAMSDASQGLLAVWAISAAVQVLGVLGIELFDTEGDALWVFTPLEILSIYSLFFLAILFVRKSILRFRLPR